MPFGPTGPTGGKNGRPSSFHAPIVGSQGAFSCTFHPEYARNRTPGRGAGLHESGGGSGDALDQARQAFLAIMERQDQAVPKSFADFSASLSRNHEIDADLGGGRTPRVMTVDLLDEMLKYGKGQSRLGTAASRRKKAASASKSRRAATPDAPIIMQVPATPFSLPDECRMSTLARRQPDAAEPAQRMVVDSPPQTAASAKTVRAWRAPTGLAAEQRRCAHLTVGDVPALTYPAVMEPWGGDPNYSASYGPGRGNVGTFEASRRALQNRDGWFGSRPARDGESILALRPSYDPSQREATDATTARPGAPQEPSSPRAQKTPGRGRLRSGGSTHMQLQGNIEQTTGSGKIFTHHEPPQRLPTRNMQRPSTGASLSFEQQPRSATPCTPVHADGGFVANASSWGGGMRPMSSGGPLLCKLKPKRPRTSSSSGAQMPRDGRQGQQEHRDVSRGGVGDRDCIPSPRASSRLSSANTQVIKIGGGGDSEDEDMAQDNADGYYSDTDPYFATGQEHEQDPDHDAQLDCNEEMIRDTGAEFQEGLRSPTRPPTNAARPPTSSRPNTSLRSPFRPATASTTSPVRDFVEREQRQDNLRSSRGEDDRGHLTERSGARLGRSVTFNPSLSMHPPGLSKKADPASVQGLIYNAFDDVETRMHGTQMGDVAALRQAKEPATVLLREDNLKRPAMSTTATNAHNSLARTRVGDERKGDRRWNSWQVDGQAGSLYWPAGKCESRPMTGIPIDPTRMHSHLRNVGNAEDGVKGFVTKARPNNTPRPSLSSPGVMQAARQQAVKYYELAGSQTISSIPFLPSHTWHPASTPPAPHNPHRNHQTSSCAIGLDVDKAGDFCYDRLASSAPANIGLTGSRRRQKDDLGGSYSSPFFRNMDYSSVDPRGGVNRKASASFHPPRYGAVRDYSDTVISHAF